MFVKDTRHWLSTLLVVLGVGSSALWGCGVNPTPESPAGAVTDPAESLGQSAAELYVASTSLWRPTSIRVCWENPSSANDVQRQWVIDAVERTWETHSSVRFLGWGTCTSNASGIRIRINDEGPHVKSLGKGLNGMAAGMVLNFTFNNWETHCRGNPRPCIESTAVHEFGHAMGYAHEQNRPDRPSSCTEPAQGSTGDWLIGPWDLSSVMNYCNPRWNGDGNLSATDKEGARATYGVPWYSLGGELTSGPAVSSWGTKRLDVFARGGDNALWHKSYDSGWNEWKSLGGSLTSDPAAVSWGTGRIDVFARGGDNALWHKWYDGIWHEWESLGGYLTSGPAVSSWASGRLDVFVRGVNNDLLHKRFDGSWREWESLGGVLTSDPAAVSWGPGRIDVFAQSTDKSLWHKVYDGGWREWESLGGYLTLSPAVSSWASGRLDVLVRGTDNALWRRVHDGGWHEWEWLGGELSSSPDVVSWGSGRLDMLYVGPDGGLRQSVYDSGW